MSYSISGTQATGITLTSSTPNPVAIEPNTQITGTIGPALYGPGGPSYSWTIDNSGTLIGPPTYIGVQLGSNASAVINGVVNNSYGGKITGDTGVYISGPGTVANGASDNPGGATITGTGVAGVNLTGAPGTVINQGGRYDGVIQGYGNALGVIESDGGSVTNLVGGIISGAEGISIGGAGLVTNSGNIIGTTDAGVELSGSTGTVVNYGLIQGYSVAVLENAGGSVTNQSAGTITAAEGISIDGVGLVFNSGNITGSTGAGVELRGGAATVVNYDFGLIQGGGVAVLEDVGGSVTNQSSATIIGYEGVQIYGGLGTVTNDGTIIGTMTAGVELVSGGTVINSGLVQGYASNIGVLEDAGGSVTNQAGGTITGNVGVVFSAAGTLTNAGIIAGNGSDAVEFNSGVGQNRLILAPTAVFTGNITSVAYADNVVELQAGVGYLGGFGTNITNFSSVQFDPGASWTITGDASDPSLGTLAISGFTVGNTIDLANFTGTIETFVSNELTLSDGTNTATLQIVGDFATSDFQVVSDDNGGVFITEGALPASFNWIGGTGAWTTDTNWDPTGVPGSIDTATITQDGTNTVTIAAADHIAVTTLTLDAAADTLEIEGTLAVTAGTIALAAGGMLNGGTIADAPGAALIATGGTLEQVAWQGVLNIANTGGLLQVSDGLTVTGLDGTGPGIINVNGEGDTLLFAAGVSVDGLAPSNTTINVGNAVSGDTIEVAFGVGTFTIGSDVTIVSDADGALATLALDAGTTAILDGAIIASAKGGTFTITDSPSETFENNGTLAVSNGDTLDVTIGIVAGSGNGTIDITSGGVASFSATVAGDQTVVFTDGTGTLQLADPADFQGVISGFDTGGTIDLQSIAADGAIWVAGTSGNPGTLTITEGLTLVGTLQLAGDFSNEVFQLGTDGAAGTFLNAIPRPASFAWNDGSADWSTAADWTPAYLPWAEADTTIAHAGTYTVTIATKESIAVKTVTLSDATATLLVQGTLATTGTIGITAGTLSVTGGLTTTDTISIAAGTLNATGDLSAASISDSGMLAFTGATGVTMSGTLDNVENTLSVGSSEPLGTMTLAAGGTIVGGTIADHGSGFIFSSGTFDGVTYDGATLQVDGDLNVTDGLVVMDAEGVGDGTIDLGGTGVSVVDFIGSQTLDHATIHLNGTGLGVTELESGGTSASILTLGTNLQIDSTLAGAHGTIGSAGSTEVINLGTIRAQAKGGLFTISPVDGLANQGLISVSHSDSLLISTGVISGTGTFEVTDGGVATFMAGVNTNQTLAFGDTTGILGFAQLNIGAKITGFAAGGTIDLKGIAADEASWVAGTNGNPGTLTISDNHLSIGRLYVTGDFSNEVFQLGTDGASGTFLNAIPRPTSYAWNNASADWNATANWTPSYQPWALADTTIAQAGTYTVTIGSKESVAVKTVTLSDATATLLVQGTLATTGIIGITAGTLNATGLLSAASIVDTGVLAIIGSRTLATPLSLGAHGTLLIEDLNTLAAATLTLGAAEVITQAGIASEIGSTRLNGEGIVNLGTINVAGGLTIDPLGFTNAGTINVGNGAALTLGGQWKNTVGTVAVTGTAAINLGGSFTTGGIGTFTGAAGVRMSGTLDNVENSLTVGAGHPLGTVTLTDGGTIVGGGIYDEGAGFVFSAGTLDGVRYHSATGLVVNGDLNVTDGLTVLDAGSGNGTISLGGTGVSVLDFVGSQTLDNAILHLNGQSAVTDLESGGASGSVLTLGANLLIDSTAIGANGTIGSAGPTGVVNLGTILGSAQNGTLRVSPANGLLNQGLIAISNRETLLVETAVVGGSGTIAVASGGFVDFMAGVAASQAIVFGDATGTIGLAQPNNVAGTISGFQVGDTIDLTGIAADVATWTKGVGGNAGTLTISNGGNRVATLAVSGDFSQTAFNLAYDGAGGTDLTNAIAPPQITPCFAAGTRIATARGAVAVERLREGDVVLTVSGGRQPIAWIGHRQVDCRRHPAKERVWPVRVAPHAFGEGRPKRPLLLSPDHSVFVEGVLIPIKFLLNETTITQVAVDTVTYYHVELPRHDVLLAEGLPAESYLETGGRSAFANAGLPMQLHPEFEPDPVRVAMVWQNFGYAPLIGDDATVERARAKLRLQAMLLEDLPAKPVRKPRRAARAA